MSTPATVHPPKLTALCYGAMMSLSIGMNLLPVFLTSIGATYGGAAGLSQEQLGRLGAFCFAGLTLGILVTGPLADRWGAKGFVLFGNAASVLCLLAMAWSPTYGALAATLFCLGFAAGVLDMVLSPVVSALNPSRRGAALNNLHSFYCVGAAVTILVGMVALGVGLTWQRASLLLIPLPLGLLFAFAPMRFPALVGEGGRTPLRALLGRGWFVLALVAIFLAGATELGLAQWLPAYAERSLGFPKWVGDGSLLLFSLMMAAGRLAVGAAGARVTPWQAMGWGCALSVVLFLAGSFLPVPGLALAACILAGFTGSALWPTMLAVTGDRHPEGGATMFAALAALGNAGGIFMPWLVGGIADRKDLHWGLAVSALAPLGMLALLGVLRRGAVTSSSSAAPHPSLPPAL